jgi:hypothetical protein
MKLVFTGSEVESPSSTCRNNVSLSLNRQHEFARAGLANDWILGSLVKQRNTENTPSSFKQDSTEFVGKSRLNNCGLFCVENLRHHVTKLTKGSDESTTLRFQPGDDVTTGFRRKAALQ